MNNIAEMINLCHSRAKDKGFWDVPTTQGERFSLIIGELFEGLEAVRKGKLVDKFDVAFAQSCQDDGHVYQEFFPQKIKDTFEDELADALIRLFDFCGGYNIDLEGSIFYLDKTIYLAYELNFGHFLHTLMQTIYIHKHIQAMCPIVYVAVVEYCKYHNIDIWAFIDLKLKYNATRERLHGKKF